MRQPFVLFALLCIAAVGAYAAFKHRKGSRRLLGAVPVCLLVLGGVVVPFVFGVRQGATGNRNGGELLIVVVAGSLISAAIAGALLWHLSAEEALGGATVPQPAA